MADEEERALREVRSDTPAAVLQAASALLTTLPFDDISYRLLGEQVGVTERTVFRHFPTRGYLLMALAERIDLLEVPFASFRDATGFASSTQERFRAFDAAPRRGLLLARAAATSPLHPAAADFVTHAVTAMVEHEAAGLNPRDLRRAVGTLRSFAGAPFWAHARSTAGLDADGAAEVVEEVTRLVLASVRPGPGAVSAPSATGTVRP